MAESRWFEVAQRPDSVFTGARGWAQTPEGILIPLAKGAMDRELGDAPARMPRPTANPSTFGAGPDTTAAALGPAGVAPGTSVEYGASGTPNYGGWISGEDYNPDLDGIKALAIYDKMRRSDAQVHASLQVMKLPLKGAQWMAVPPKHGDAQDQAIADAVNKFLFDDDAMAVPWVRTLNSVLMRLEFGFSVCEKVWTLDEDQPSPMLRYARIAPRLPKTIYRWQLNVDGQLRSIVQFALKDGVFGWWEIPAEAAFVSTRNREGDNYYGMSVLRTAYMHWFFKTEAYKIDAVRLDRFGIGIPVASLSEKFTPSDEERTEIIKQLKGLRSHERSYILQPWGVTYSILTPQGTGQGGAMGLMESVDHHNVMIARNALAGFMAQHEQQYGSKASTSTLADMFLAALQGEAAEMTGDIKQQLVKPFCDANFSMHGREYPTVIVKDLADVNVSALCDNLNKLGRFITPTDDLEDMLRDLMQAPPLPESARGQSRQPPAPVVPGLQPPAVEPEPRPGPPAPKAAATKALEDEDDVEDDTPAVDPKETKAPVKASAVLVTQTPPPTRYEENGIRYGRIPNALERRVLSLSGIPDRLTRERQELLRSLADIRREQLTTLTAAAVKADGQDTSAFTDLRPDNFRVTGTAAMAKAIKAMQTRVVAFGAEEVRRELIRQGAPLTLATQHKSPGANKRAAKSQLVTSAEITADKQTATWQARILETAARLRRSGKTGDDLRTAVETALHAEIESGARRDVDAEVNEAFAVGRETEALAQADLIEKAIYSSLLDENTCDVCEAADGTEVQLESPEYYDLLPPNQNCQGNKGAPDACRCVFIYLFADSQ